MTPVEWQSQDWKRLWGTDKLFDAIGMWSMYCLLLVNSPWAKTFAVVSAVLASVRWILFQVMSRLSRSAKDSHRG